MVNFHSHNIHSTDGISVISLFVTEADNIESSGFYSIGIHPWHTSESNLVDQLSKLNAFSTNENVIAIGEIGLDRLKGADLKTQLEIFDKQVQIAEKAKKPIVIHCVKAWSEIIEYKKTHPTTIKWAIHGFRGNTELAKQLIECDFYLSFGTDLINPSPSLSETLTITPLNRIFFETDDSPIPIYEVYSAAADILDTSISQLKEQITSNFKEFIR